MTYCDQNIVLQTPEEEACVTIPGENPLNDLMHRSALCICSVATNSVQLAPGVCEGNTARAVLLPASC